jgi:hypothetical protein
MVWMSGILRIAARLVCTTGNNADNNLGYYCYRNAGEQAHGFFPLGLTNPYQKSLPVNHSASSAVNSAAYITKNAREMTRMAAEANGVGEGNRHASSKMPAKCPGL